MIAVVLLALAAVVVSDNCGKGAENIGGNWYCSPVNAIQYTDVGSAGSYRQITNMAADGTCSSVPKAFAGPLAPFNEEVSLHFRGPLALKQFAVYNLGSLGKRDAKQNAIEGAALKKRDMVTATIDGQIVSWENNYFGPSSAAPALPPAQPPSTLSVAPAPLPKTTTLPMDNSADYIRVGYYDSASQHLDGLTFLGNYGGSGSGVFDYSYGSSLSYLSADGLAGASSAQVLKDTTIPSNTEFAIMTNKICNDGDCGYTRLGSVVYHGFDGPDKMFLFEFMMPLDGNTGFNGDMPAIWMLNAQIPRTLQYGNAECSCWISGCGELDIVEALSPGSTRCKSTIHSNTSGGNSDYILRPTSQPMKLAVVFRSAASTVHIQVLPDDATFDNSLTAAQVGTWCESSTGSSLSIFAIGHANARL